MRRSARLFALVLPLVFLGSSRAEPLTSPGTESMEARPSPKTRPALLLGARAALLLPSSGITPTGSVALDLQWRSAVHDRRLGVAMDIGWYRIAGEGTTVDPDIGTYDFSWSAHAAPAHLGLVYEPRLLAFIPGFWPFIEGGAALVPLFSFATLQNQSGHVFLRDNPGRGLAVGLYAGAGGALELGRGEILALLRWTSAYTDMGYPWINLDPGDPCGLEFFLGYRLGI